MSGRQWNWLATLARRVTSSTLGLAVAANLAFVIGLMVIRPQLYGEAEVLFEAARIRARLPLYTDPLVGAFDYGPVPSRYFVCYPPLWSFVLSLVPASIAPLFGRLACSFAWFGALAAMARAGRGDKRSAGLVAAAYGAGIFVIANFAASGRPDSIALAIAAWALARSLRLAKVDLFAAALFALAAWVKPNVIGLAGGAFLATILVAPRSWKSLAAGVAAISLPLACILHVVSDGTWILHFQRSLLQSMMMSYWWEQIWRRALFAVPAAFVLWVGFRGRGTPSGRLAFAAFATALGWSVVSLGKVGGASNYWMEAALGAVAVLRVCPVPPLAPRTRAVAWGLGAVHASWLAAATAGSVLDALATEPARHAVIARARTVCGGSGSRVLLSDHPGVENEVNGRIVSPSFQTEWLVLTGAFPADVPLRDLAHPEVRCLLTTQPVEEAFFAPPVKQALIAKFARVGEGGGWTLYLARPSPDHP